MIELRDGSHVWVKPENVTTLAIGIVKGKVNLDATLALAQFGGGDASPEPVPLMPDKFLLTVRVVNGAETLSFKFEHDTKEAAEAELKIILEKIKPVVAP